MRLLRIAEQESGNFHATPENSAEGPDAGTPELPLPTTRLELKEEIANGDTSPHPAETYVASEADVAISAEHEGGNSYAAPECATQKSEGVSKDPRGFRTDPMNGDCCLVPTIPCRTMKSRVFAQANQLECDWVRAVSAVPNADSFQGGVDEFRPRSANAGQQNKHPHHLGRLHFYSISPVHLEHGLEALPRLPECYRDGVPCCER